MAEVDHAYQYSVEVKSRFSLFLDDNLNNEDPDLLISKLQQAKRNEKKKEKSVKGTVKAESFSVPTEADVKHETPVVKEKPVALPKSPKADPPVLSPQAQINDVPVINAGSPPQNLRGRGGPRGFNRGFRGRGQGFRPFQDAPESAGDAPRDMYVPRGRGRGRGRGGFGRGGQMYTDFRETENGTRNHTEEVPEAPLEEHTVNEEVNDVPEHQANEHEAVVDEIVEEPKVLTLEEYKALRSSQRPAVALSNKSSRKPNDGKDVFANMIAHRKINEVSDEEVVEVEREPEDSQNININWTYTDRQESRGRGRGFVGGRGFPRGRNPRGGPMPRGRGMRGDFRGGRGYERQAAPPVIYSDQDFPSLK